MAVKVGTGHVEIVPDMAKFRAQVERGFRRSQLRNTIKGELRAAERDIGERMGRIGDKLSAAGGSLTRGVTLPIVGMGAASVKASMDFETAFAGVRKTVQGTEKDFSELREGLREMSKETGTNVNQLTAIAEAAGAMGIATKDILAFTDVVNKLDVATDLTADSAATALGKLKNVLDLDTDDLDNLSAAIVDLGNTGNSTEPEIVDLALRIAGAGKNAGLSTAEILAFSAAVADAGIEAERGGTAIQKTLQDIATAVATGDDLKGFAKVAGQSAKDFARSFDEEPAQAVARFIDGLQRIRAQAGPGGVIVALKDIGISESRQVDTLQRLSGAQSELTDKIDQSAAAYKDGTAAQTEFDKVMQTSGKKVDKIKATFADMFITLGDELIPVLERLVDSGAIENIAESIGDMAAAFGRLSPGQQELIIKGMLGAAALGPSLQAFGGILGGLSKVATLFRTAKTADDILKIGSAAGSSAGGVGALAASLGVLAAAVVGFKIGSEIYDVIEEEIIKPIDEAQRHVEDQATAMQGRLIKELHDTFGLASSQIAPFTRALNDMRTEGELTPEVLSTIYDNLALFADAAKLGIPLQQVLIDIADGGRFAKDGLVELQSQVDAMKGPPASLTTMREEFSKLSEVTGRETTNALAHFETLEDGSRILAIETTNGLVRIGDGFRNYVAGLRTDSGNVIGLYRSMDGSIEAFAQTAQGVERVSLSGFTGSAETLAETLGISVDEAQRLLDKVNELDGQKITIPVEFDILPIAAHSGPAGLALANAGFHDGGLVMHEGGFIPSMHSGGLRSDERLIKAQAGEYMIQRDAVRAVGTDFLDRLNELDDVVPGGGSRRGRQIVIPVTVPVDGAVLARATIVHYDRELEAERTRRG